MVAKNMKGFFTAKNIAYVAVLLALVIVLQAFGGTISIGAVQLNFTLIPIVVGAILFGPLVGALLGFACGVVVLVQVIMGLAPFYTVIWTNSPFVTILTCIVKTTAAGALAGFVYRWIEKKNKLVAVFVASGLVPVVNTGLFILGCLCMSGTIQIFQNNIEMSGMNVFIFIVVILVTWNFFIEFAVNLLVAPAIHRVVIVVEKYLGKRHSRHSKADYEEESPDAQSAKECLDQSKSEDSPDTEFKS